MNISGIYKIQSLSKPERCYIGSAININRRWQGHLNHLRRGIHHSKKLQNHFNKYGKNDFKFSILIGCDKEDLITTEQFFIDANKPWFNVRLKAESNLGLKHTENSCKNMSIARLGQTSGMKGKHHSKETRDKMSGKIPWNKGKKTSIEAIEKRKQSLKLHPYIPSKETNKKVSKSLIGNKRRLGIAPSNKGTKGLVKMSEETCKQMSESGKEAWKARKQEVIIINSN